MQKFWMVWRAGTKQMTMQHASEEAAVEEAKRLAEKEKQGTFVVLEAVKIVKPLVVAVSVEDPAPIVRSDDPQEAFGRPVGAWNPRRPSAESMEPAGDQYEDVPF